jgi:hypothetical protein
MLGYFHTRNFHSLKMVETLLQHSKDRVENRGRGSATPTQMDVCIVTAK